MDRKPLPDIQFGDTPMDEDDLPELADDLDDDEELAKTPADVIDILGFDPLDDSDA